jgi:uncharacterized protein (TIGR02453 family)
MSFAGFPPETVKFLAGLSRNNEKDWFEAHRDDYDAYFVEPAKSFVGAIAPHLRKIDPSVQAVPAVSGSIMRIYRDVRFAVSPLHAWLQGMGR